MQGGQRHKLTRSRSHLCPLIGRLAIVGRMSPVRTKPPTNRTIGAHRRFSEGSDAARLRGVEIFASGTHRGKTYTEADLDAMVQNFQEFSAGPKPLVAVPAVLGHEETQEFLDRTDLPAAAWAERVYRDGGKLRADFTDVPAKVAKLIRTRRYRTVSAEVYDEPPTGVPGKGKMLRRVAFLGGDIPQIKSLDDIPMPEEHNERGGERGDSSGVRARTFARYTPVVLKFREARALQRPGRTWAVFSEVTPMDRQQMIARLAELGYDTAVFTDAVPDEVIAEILRVADAGGGEGDDANDLDEGGEGGNDDDATRQHDDTGGGANDPAKKPADSKNCDDPSKKMADGSPAAAATVPNPGGAQPPVNTYGQPKQVTMKYSEVKKLVQSAVAAALKPLQGRVAKIDKFAEERIAAEKKARVKAELDVLVQQGKVMPAERDAGLDDALLAMDAITLHKFSDKDGKVVEQSAFDRMLATLKARPTITRFGERFKDPAAASGTGSDEEQVAQHFERFSEQFRANGMTKERFVGAFKAQQKIRPMTAAEFLSTSTKSAA